MIDRLKQVSGRDVPRETYERLEAYAALLVEESSNQNLIAASTLDQMWERHLVDSAQLLRYAPAGSWVDIGSGAGLPGVVIAILSGDPVTLVEPRRLRTEFLTRVKDRLDLSNITIIHGKGSALCAMFEKITARAVAPATELLAMTHHLSRPDTVWLLPKGRSAQKELDEVRRSWQGAFRLEPSLTDPDASILLASGIRPRGRR